MTQRLRKCISCSGFFCKIKLNWSFVPKQRKNNVNEVQIWHNKFLLLNFLLNSFFLYKSALIQTRFHLLTYLLQSWQNVDICFFVILITIAKVLFLEEEAGDQTVFPTSLEFFLISPNFPRILFFLAIREVSLAQSLIQYI